MTEQRSQITGRGLAWTGLLGGLGGAINAGLCYAKIPAPSADFNWSIIPAGAAHGALLALISIGLVVCFLGRALPLRLLGLLVTGWLSGWLSFIPINLSLGTHDWTGVDKNGLSAAEILHSLWPFGSWDLSILWAPFSWFGLVGVVVYMLLNLCGVLASRRLRVHLLVASLGGILGSLWWWWGITSKLWYFSLIHGTIWGSLVGYGVWRAQQSTVTEIVKESRTP